MAPVFMRKAVDRALPQLEIWRTSPRVDIVDCFRYAPGLSAAALTLAVVQSSFNFSLVYCGMYGLSWSKVAGGVVGMNSSLGRYIANLASSAEERARSLRIAEHQEDGFLPVPLEYRL